MSDIRNVTTMASDACRTYPRRFVRQDELLDSWDRIAPYFDQLGNRPIEGVDELVRWIDDYSELSACISEVGTDRHVKMTCQTDDPERKAAFLDFIENIDPKTKPASHALDVKFTQSPYADQLDPHRYQVLARALRSSVELFREENVELETREAKLTQQFQETCGAQIVEFDGKEQTLQQLAAYQERTDRSIREQAWKVDAARRLQDAGTLEDIFDQMIQLRQQMARNADCANYLEYGFKQKLRFDYTADDCLAFHDAIERAVVPVLREHQKRRCATMGLDSLRPWDLAVDVKGRPPLDPFQTPDELCEKVSQVFHRVDPEFGRQFDDMRAAGYLDLASRKGKAPGGYQATYDELRHPFIFMNAVGRQSDVRTMIHEGGHAFHCMAARRDPILNYRHSPIEFAEVASFGMELFGLEELDVFYDEEGVARARRAQLEGIISLFPWVATIDAFQHFLYASPDHTRDDRARHWLDLRRRFGGVVDYTGHEEALQFAWQRQLHLFEVPLYYIEYGIAQLGALQVWCNAKRDRADAIRRYKAGLAFGGSRPLPELFAAAGAAFEFSYETVAPLIDTICAELAKLPE